MHVALGQQLRQIYQGFLPGNFSGSQIWVRSTDVPRTVESAASFISGLYPNNAINPTLVDIWLNEQSVDSMALPSNCPLAVQLCNSAQITQEWVDHVQAMKPLQEQLMTQWGIPASQFPVWIAIQGTLQCRQAAGVKNPSYLSDSQADSIIDLANWMMGPLWNNTRAAQAISGPFMQELRDNIVNAVNGVANQPIFRLYSGHDTTVGPLLAALQAFPSQWPPFAANVRLELYQSDQGWAVRGLYNGDVIRFGNQVPCDEYCPLDQFLSIVNQAIPVDYSALCNSVPPAKALNQYTSFLCCNSC